MVNDMAVDCVPFMRHTNCHQNYIIIDHKYKPHLFGSSRWVGILQVLLFHKQHGSILIEL